MLALAALAACDGSGAQRAPEADKREAAPSTSLRFEDVPEDAQADQAPDPILAAQVRLDRLGFSSGVIDGRESTNFRAALRGYQMARALPQTGRLDPATQQALDGESAVPAVRRVRIPASFARGPFVPDLPNETAKQADFPHLGYRSLTEALAERFHTTPQTLVALNGPGAKVGAGAVIVVPNVPDIDAAGLGQDERGWNRTLETLAVAPVQPAAARVVVDKSEGVLRAFDAQDRLLAQFPATMGSSHDPLPIGSWKILGISRNPDFHYNPKLFWDVSDSKQPALLKPGPNGPVGVVWIDLSKPHYGIHGTGSPEGIGHAESHGCIRLTNWDAARLAQMVKAGVPAIFQP